MISKQGDQERKRSNENIHRLQASQVCFNLNQRCRNAFPNKNDSLARSRIGESFQAPPQYMHRPPLLSYQGWSRLPDTSGALNCFKAYRIQTWSPKNSANAAFACWTASLLRTKPGPPIGMSSLPFRWWQRNSGWGRGSNSTFKTGMGSTRPPGLHNRFIAPTLTWQWLFPARCPKLENTCEMEKAHGQSATKKGSFLEMCVLLASNCFHQFPFPCWTPGQSGIRLLVMWFRTLANHVTKNCTLTHCASNPLVCHQTPPSQLKLAQTCQAQQCQSYRIPKKLASTKVFTQGLASDKPCLLFACRCSNVDIAHVWLLKTDDWNA